MTEPTFQTLGRYTIRAEIGRGGFATVYQALDASLNREVALKVLHPQMSADRTFVERFRKEARTLASLRHPHVITVYEVSEVEGRLFIAMELAHGPSLAKAITERKRFSWAEALSILKLVSEALDYAHGQGVVHRDLKPANVLLDAERGPLLTDFGFARLLGDSSASMSLSGGILGTPAYIAPEVWELDTATPAADIYALGCIVYEMLTGDVLFPGKTPMQSMRAHDHGPQFPAAWPPDVPLGLEAALQVALARKPENRYPTATTFWHALNDLETNAQATREQAERQAVADQWKAEATAAMAAGEWSAAKMAVGRWLSITPDDAQALAARQEIERQIEQQARQKEEAERAAQIALVAGSARKAQEEADRKAQADADRKTKEDRERQRQAELAAQAATAEKAKQEAAERERQKQAREAAKLAEEETRRKELAATQKPVVAKPVQRTQSTAPAPRAKSNKTWLYVVGGVIAVVVIALVLVGINPPSPASTPAPAQPAEPAAPAQPLEASATPTEAPAPPLEPPADAPPEPVRPNVLRVNLSVYPEIADPQRSSASNELATLKMIYEGLTKFDGNLETIPGAAESWEYNSDATQLTFQLRPDLKYSDGSPLNAKRFEYSIIRYLDPATAGNYPGLMNAIVGAEEWQSVDTTAAGYDRQKYVDALGVKALDGNGQPCQDYEQADCRTLRLDFRGAAPFFHTIMATWAAYPAKEENIAEGGENWWNSSEYQIGNGPFTLQVVEPSVQQYFVPNSEYWGEKPGYDLEYRYITDSAAAFDAYKNNELDVIPSAVEDVDAINADSNLKAQHIVYPGSCTLVFKFSFAPDSILQDKRVREAFAHGFDAERWSQEVDNGLTTPTQTWIPPGYPGHDASETSWKFDPEKARQLLAEAGYPGGQGLNDPGLKITFADTSLNRTRAEWLVDNYQQTLGIELVLDPVDQTTFSTRARDPRTFPFLVRQGWCADYPDPQNWLSAYWKSDTAIAQRQGYKNTEFDELVSQADAELDPAKRMELYLEAQRILVQDLPAIFGYNTTNHYLVKPWVTGMTQTPQDTDWPGSVVPQSITIDTYMQQ
jgi:oligopeptide transport system substrate-binding protein